MGVTKQKHGRRVLGLARTALPRAAKPVPLPAIDVDALFDDTMRRYPQTMARLAE